MRKEERARGNEGKKEEAKGTTSGGQVNADVASRLFPP